MNQTSRQLWTSEKMCFILKLFLCQVFCANPRHLNPQNQSIVFCGEMPTDALLQLEFRYALCQLDTTIVLTSMWLWHWIPFRSVLAMWRSRHLGICHRRWGVYDGLSTFTAFITATPSARYRPLSLIYSRGSKKVARNAICSSNLSALALCAFGAGRKKSCPTQFHNPNHLLDVWVRNTLPITRLFGL
jgi:hypothetical protein